MELGIGGVGIALIQLAFCQDRRCVSRPSIHRIFGKDRPYAFTPVAAVRAINQIFLFSCRRPDEESSP